MKKVLFSVLLLLLVACSNEDTKSDELSQNAQIAQQYVEEMGYTIESVEQEDVLRFAEDEMHLPPNKSFWAVQTIEPTNYIEQDLARVTFLVNNHPLANSYESEQTQVDVVLFKDEVIAATSMPHTKEPLMGATSSIDGKSAEDVQDDYSEWSEQWDEMYGEY